MKKSYLVRFARLILGVILCGVGIAFSIKGNIGFSPWDVLHMGIAQTTGIMYGTANSGVGVLIMVVAVIMGEKLGVGTVFNIIGIGRVVDIVLSLNILPTNTNENILMGLAMMTVGITITATGVFLYMGAELGCGPRDSMMVGLKKKFPTIPVGVFKSSLEVFAVVSGFILGGKVGVGTIYAAVAAGFITQMVFNICHFKVDKLQQESIFATFKYVFLRGSAALPAEQTDSPPLAEISETEELCAKLQLDLAEQAESETAEATQNSTESEVAEDTKIKV